MKNQANNILTENNQHIIKKIITASTYLPRQSCILFGVTTDDRIREETERQVEEGLKEIRSLQYMNMRDYRENYTEFLPALRELSQRESCFVFVRGLDDLIALDIAEDRMVGSRPLILNYLNMNREFFLAYPVHLLFWISPETERMLFDLAPDLWAFRTHSHFFDEIVREEPPDLSSLKIIELVPDEGKREDLERDIKIKEKLLVKFLPEDGAKLSYQALGLLKELAVRYYLKRDYEKALKYAEQSLNKEGEGKNDPELLNILGLCYGRNKEYENAEEVLEKALRIAEEIFIYRDWKGILQNNLGVLFYWREDWEKSEEYFDKALKNTPSPDKSGDREDGESGSYNESRNKYNRVFILSNRGTVLFREMKLEEAGECYFEVFKAFIIEEPELFGQSIYHFNEYEKQFHKKKIARTQRDSIHDFMKVYNREIFSKSSYFPICSTADFFNDWGILLYIEGILDSSATLLSLAMKFYNLGGSNDFAVEVLHWILNRTLWKKLDLYDSGLTSIPPEIGNLEDLHYLNLSENQISIIPPEIGDIKKMKVLGLSYNQILTICPEIGNLQNLKELYLVNNQISVIPPEIGSLENLGWLDLSNNKISVIPTEIGNLKNLNSLYLSKNQISIIPSETGSLESLRYLYLSNNQISIIPTEIENLKNLERLDLSSNKISVIPTEIGNLINLKSIYLSKNPISRIPSEIGNLKNLNYLNLSGIQISTIPTEIGSLGNLERLDLSGNQIAVIPNEIGNLKNLKRLDLRGNPLPIPDEILAKTDSPSEILDYYFNKKEK